VRVKFIWHSGRVISSLFDNFAASFALADKFVLGTIPLRTDKKLFIVQIRALEAGMAMLGVGRAKRYLFFCGSLKLPTAGKLQGRQKEQKT